MKVSTLGGSEVAMIEERIDFTFSYRIQEVRVSEIDLP